MAHLSTDPSSKERWIIVYPAYLNSRRTVEQGRRVPKTKFFKEWITTKEDKRKFHHRIVTHSLNSWGRGGSVIPGQMKDWKDSGKGIDNYVITSHLQAADNPTVHEIRDVCQSQGLNCDIENKFYPRDSAKDAMCKGRVRVQLKNSDESFVNEKFKSRKALFQFIGEMIPKLKSRQSKSSQSDSSGQQQGGGASSKKKKGKKGKGK